MKGRVKIMKEKIEKELKELNEMYDFYLRKSESEYSEITNNRIHDLWIEITTYEKVLEMIGE